MGVYRCMGYVQMYGMYRCIWAILTYGRCMGSIQIDRGHTDVGEYNCMGLCTGVWEAYKCMGNVQMYEVYRCIWAMQTYGRCMGSIQTNRGHTDVWEHTDVLGVCTRVWGAYRCMGDVQMWGHTDIPKHTDSQTYLPHACQLQLGALFPINFKFVPYRQQSYI